MYFENSCRDFAVDRKLDLVVYTGKYVIFEKPYKFQPLGTSGVLQLLDVNDNLVDIYLYGGDKLPVPRCVLVAVFLS